jgi:hypothetical protein
MDCLACARNDDARRAASLRRRRLHITAKLRQAIGQPQCRGTGVGRRDQCQFSLVDAVIVPLHTDGWAHFRQNGDDLRATFDTLGFGARLKLLEPGVATVIEPSQSA